jgi:DNA polymerase-3 subunit epsilon
MNILDQDLLFCDLETTGGNSRVDRIMEVGLVDVRNGKVIERYKQLVDPERPVSRFITNITGIDDSMLLGKPLFADIAAEIFDRLDGKLFIAHSANFDYRFLQRELAMVGYDFETKPICTVKLSRALYPEYRKHNLDILLERFELSCVDRHRALDDAKVLWDLWQIFEAERSEGFIPALEKQLQKPKIELNICPKNFDTLSDLPGVYVLSDDERVLFIGSAKNLQAQVKSHFTGDEIKKRDRKLARELTKIKTLDAIGPIAARLKMIEQKKLHRPRYNRKLNESAEHWSWRLVRDRDGFLAPNFFSFIPEEEGVEVGSFGLFTTKAQAQKKLKEALAGVGIFDERYERVGNPLMRNVRLELALSSFKHLVWPHESSYLCTEHCAQRNLRIVHVFDQWCYLGSADSDDEVVSLKESAERRFCPHLYSVIRSAVDG